MPFFKSLSIRVSLSPIFNKRFIICSSYSSYSYSSPSVHSLFPGSLSSGAIADYQAKDVASTFIDWFKYRNDALLDRIFEILALQADGLGSRRSDELALSQLGLRLSEKFVLKVLNHGQDVLSCLKFFDWAGTQPGYRHTRATFNAIFKILSKAKLMSLMLDFLESYKNQRHLHRVRFYDTLVMGYAVAGKPSIALQLFGKMRFQGLDLGVIAYHVLLNALVEESRFDVVEVIFKQITLRGLNNEITHSIMVKFFCKQNRLEEAEMYLRGLVSKEDFISDHVVGFLVDALCKSNDFDKAGRLVEEFRELGKVPMYTYGIWIRDLVQAGKVDLAMEFLQSKKLSEGYIPDVFRYNVLICRLLRENRLEEVCDLLMEMREAQISPDKVTMNAALCFFCKAGMVDVALELYNSRSEFGFSPNSYAYNYLINTLCGDGSVDEAYGVLKSIIAQGYFPGKKSFSILVDALCREGKLDKMSEMVVVALERKIILSSAAYDKIILSFCNARRVEDGYLLLGELNSIDKVTSRHAYFNLIYAFNKSNRGDMASRLLIEMQENGHAPTRKLYRAVIRCLCGMDNPENEFLKLLKMQLSCHEPNCQIYNYFIDGAGHAKKPELARKIFEMMARSGVEHNLDSDILMLQSYLRSERIADALNLFGDLSKKRYKGKKMYNAFIVGLCKANRSSLALEFWGKMRERGLVPCLKCYEELVQSLCLDHKYDMVVKVIVDLEIAGRRVSTFIGNILLLHSLKTQALYEAWVRSGSVNEEALPSGNLMLAHLVGLFSGYIRVDQHIENWEALIEQCFPLDIFTYNMLLRRLSMSNTMGDVCMLFNRICEKGYKPNRWTYDTIAYGFFRHGRTDEGRRWMTKMPQEEFDPTEPTKQFL